MESVQLSRVLKQLLENYPVVVLPGLGRLRTVFCPARFRPYAGTYSDPKLDVIFEKGDFADDRILSSAVSEKFGLYAQDAAVQIQECIKEWTILLYRNQFVEFPELGTLYFGAQSKLCFKLREGVVIKADAAASFEQQAPVLNSDSESAPLAHKAPQAPLANQAPLATPQALQEESKDSVILRRGKWWIMAMAAVLIGSGLYFYFSAKKADEQQAQLVNLKPRVVPKETAPTQDTVKPPKDTAKAAPVNTAPLKQNKPATSTARVKPVRLNVHIVSGSQVSRETALAQQKDYKRKGIKTELLTMKNGKFLLSLGLYRSREEADNALPAQKRKIRSARIIEL